MLFFIIRGSKPMPEVELACGSASTNNVLYSRTAKLAARLIDDVVFPTPPFWLAKAIILLILCVPIFITGIAFVPTENRGKNFLFSQRYFAGLKIHILTIQKSTACGNLQTKTIIELMNEC